MKVIEHVHLDGSSSFEFTAITHGEWAAVQKLTGSELIDHIRATAEIVSKRVAKPQPEPDPDEPMVIGRG